MHIDNEKGIQSSTSQKMNLLMGTTLSFLAHLHPDHPPHLDKEDDSFCKSPKALSKYYDDVIAYYNKNDYSDPRVTKALIMIHYLDTLARMSISAHGFECLFSEGENNPNPLLAVAFYNDISINSKGKMILSKVSPAEYAAYLEVITEKYIPKEKFSHGELDWLKPKGTFLIKKIVK